MRTAGSRLRILSDSGETFADRRSAGEILARELGRFRGTPSVVLGIPRGGVIVAREVARRLELPCDVVLVRKVGMPGNPEYALGAVSEDGQFVASGPEEAALRDYVEAETGAQMAEIRRRRSLYREVLPREPVAGKTVLVVDDGIATGSTMQAALLSLRSEGAGSLVVAVPVAAPESLERLAHDADEILCLQAPPYFSAVGQFYVDFGQVEDDELVQLLRAEAERRRAVKA